MIRLTDRQDMTLDLYHEHRTTVQQQQQYELQIGGCTCDLSRRYRNFHIYGLFPMHLSSTHLGLLWGNILLVKMVV